MGYLAEYNRLVKVGPSLAEAAAEPMLDVSGLRATRASSMSRPGRGVSSSRPLFKANQRWCILWERLGRQWITPWYARRRHPGLIGDLGPGR